MLDEEMFNEDNNFEDFTYEQYVEAHQTRFGEDAEDNELDYIRNKILRKIKGEDILFTERELKIIFDLTNY